jgi:hypothetical protein
MPRIALKGVLERAGRQRRKGLPWWCLLGFLRLSRRQSMITRQTAASPVAKQCVAWSSWG